MRITGKDLSIYIHIPFCLFKCPYCHFYSIAYQKKFETDYLNALKKHIDLYRSLINQRETVSIYFGGGTPSLLSTETLKIILEHLNVKAQEITIEITPDSFLYEHIKEYQKMGINRFSIGVQAFDDNILKILNRRHFCKNSKDLIKALNDHSIENISIDLMLDVMHQDFMGFQKSLKQIEEFNISHISLYNLVFEKNTPFYKKKEILQKYQPKEKESLKMLDFATDYFQKSGFFRYEISAFAKKGFESKHNLRYWQGSEFLGFGPSAFSYLNGIRFQNKRSFKRYINALFSNERPIDFEEKLKYPDNINELIAINLRVIDGIDILNFEKKFGKIPLNTLKILKKSDFLDNNGKSFKLNKKGLLFYDALASEII